MPIRISSGFNWMSFNTVVPLCEREKYFSTMPAVVSVPTISSVVRRRSVINPLSFIIRSNCPTASRNFVTVSLSSISFGIIFPLHSVLNVLS